MAMAESETLAMARKSRELKAQGKDIINLSLGEPDFDTPRFIKDAAVQAIEENFSHYTPVAGYDELLEAIVRKFKRDNGLEFKKSQVITSTGAKQSIANVIMATINPGDEVIVPAPYWVSYREIIRMSGGIPVVVPAGIDQDFKAPATDIEKHITAKTKVLLFSSPNNPSGAAYTYDELRELATMLGKYPHILVVSDEIYELLTFDGKHHSIGAFPEVKDRTVTINGLSKAFAMTGWRLGYMGGPEHIVQACIKIQGQITSATCSITQRAAITALESEPFMVEYMKDEFRQRRQITWERLTKVPGFRVNFPPAAFYFYIGVEELIGKKNGTEIISSTDELCMYLLHEAGVALVPGSAFGVDPYIRLSFSAAVSQILAAIDRVEAAVQKLN